MPMDSPASGAGESSNSSLVTASPRPLAMARPDAVQENRPFLTLMPCALAEKNPVRAKNGSDLKGCACNPAIRKLLTRYANGLRVIQTILRITSHVPCRVMSINLGPNATSLQLLLSQTLPWVPGDAHESLANLFTIRRAHKGEALLLQGDISQHALLVEEGLLRVFFSRDDGREFNKNFFTERSVLLPLTASMARSPSLFGIATLEDSTLWVARHRELKAKLNQLGVWHTVQRKLLAAMVSAKLQREHDLLSLTGSLRFARFCEQHPHLSERVPVGHLASYLGLTDVSLSRIRSANRITDNKSDRQRTRKILPVSMPSRERS